MQQTELNGILLMDKPQGFTSHDVVAKLRGILHTQEIGHGGTLDPLATGVLPVFIGGATKAADFAAAQDKEYVAGFTLGYCTDTQDVTGGIVQDSGRCAAEYAVEQCGRPLCRTQQQMPPMYSAVKVNGQKLYDLARKGKEVERPARDITVHAIELLEFDEHAQKGTLRLTVSKGTYVRTLINDLGEALGTLAVLHSLARTRSGAYTLRTAAAASRTASGRWRRHDAAALAADRQPVYRLHPACALTAEGAERIARGAVVFPRMTAGHARNRRRAVPRVPRGAFFHARSGTRARQGGLGLFVYKNFR